MTRRVLRRLPMLLMIVAAAGCGPTNQTANLTELQKVRSGDLDVVLLSANDRLRQGKGAFVLEFRAASDQHLIDVGMVRVNATMPMPGAPMFSTIDVQSTDTRGRYAAASDFTMAGTWRLSVEWDGPAGRGSVIFPGAVQ